jgi:uncharacterized protein YeaO (DUF488 family)
LTETLDVCGAI